MTGITYSYKRYAPYGAGDMWCIDGYVDEDFRGNVLKHLLEEREGFSISEKPNKLGNYDLLLRGENIAQLVKE